MRDTDQQSHCATQQSHCEESRQGCEGRVTAHQARMRLNKRIRSHRRAKRSESNSALNAAKAAFSALQYLEGRSCFKFPSSNKTLESEIARHRKTFACVLNVCRNFVDEVSAASDRVPPQNFDMDFDNDSFIFPSSYPSSL
eukprot:g73333.t1